MSADRLNTINEKPQITQITQIFPLYFFETSRLCVSFLSGLTDFNPRSSAFIRGLFSEGL